MRASPFISKTLHVLSVFLAPWVCAEAPPEGGPDTLRISNRLQPLEERHVFRTEGYYNWCPSIIRDSDGRFHLFYSRWKKEYSFSGWLTHSEVAHAVADRPEGPWSFRNTVLANRNSGTWDAITAHNPKIKFFDGKYYLYYVSTHGGPRGYSEPELVDIALKGHRFSGWWEFLRPNQRVGVAVATSIDGPWTRADKPLIEPSGPIATITANPAIARGPDGTYHLIVKGDKPNETRFVRNQAIATSDSPTGPFRMHPKAVIDDLDTEDISMWYDAKRGRFYAVFHAHTFIGMMTSPDGLNWSKASDYVLTGNRLRTADGPDLVPDAPLQRPFVYVEDHEPRVLALAIKKGAESYLVFVPIGDSTG